MTRLHAGGAPGMEDRWVEIDGLRIHYLFRDGSGPDIVVLPGGVIDSTTLTWKKVLQSVPERFRIFAVDLPGYGGSEALPSAAGKTNLGDGPRPRRLHTTRWYADVIHAFLLRHEITRPVLLGASMGGAVALELAHAIDPRALVLAGAHGLRGRVAFHEAAYLVSRRNWAPILRPLLRRRVVMRLALRFVIHDRSRIDRELVDDALREVRRDGALDAFFRWLRHDLAPRDIRSNSGERVETMELPVLLLHGRYDWLYPVEAAQEAAVRFRNAELEILEAGHMAPRERPEEVAAAVNRFLSAAASV